MQTHDPLSSIRMRLNTAAAAGDSSFECMGRQFIVHANVFPPTHFQSTGIFTTSLDYVPGRSFLEIGCGAGITAVTAALEGCCPVVASDISEAAVKNTRANVEKHSVAALVSVRHGDLFDVLDGTERFDVIFWNSNFVLVPENYEFEQDVHRAFCDPGYAAHERFLRQAPNHLNPDGKILLGFSGQGNDAALHQLLAKYGYEMATIMSKQGEGPGAHRYDILHLLPTNQRIPTLDMEKTEPRA